MTDQSAWTMDRRSLGTAFWTFLPLVYLLSAVPIVIFLALFRQPIGVADEWSHVARAAQLADGHLFTQFAEAGKPPLGSIDPNFMELMRQVHARRNEIMATLMPDLENVRWTDERQLANYNSSVYFPAPFLVSALALKGGQAVGATIVETLRIVNLCNGLLCAVLTAVAIALAPRGKAMIFIVAILPMSLFLFASASPDGPLISLSFLAFSLLGRSIARQESSPAEFSVLTILSVVVAATKLPYLPLFLAAIAAMWLGSSPWRRPSLIIPAISAAVLLVISIGWSVMTKAGSIDVSWGAGAGSPSAQIAFLLQHPGAVLLLAWRTITAYGWDYLHQMVGYLGWQDAPISVTGKILFLSIIAVALIFDSPSDRFGAAQVGILMGLLASFGAVFLSLYVAVNPVGLLNPIEGIQGRYFLPLLAFAAILIPPAARETWRRPILSFVLIASVPIACLETMTTVIARYYV